MTDSDFKILEVCIILFNQSLLPNNALKCPLGVGFLCSGIAVIHYDVLMFAV